jgi:carbon storage regulator
MLMMRRRAGETILIGGEIEIHIAQIGRSRVKVGIVAPRHLRVVAQEVEMVETENRAAAGRLPDPAVAAALVARALEK